MIHGSAYTTNYGLSHDIYYILECLARSEVDNSDQESGMVVFYRLNKNVFVKTPFAGCRRRRNET